MTLDFSPPDVEGLTLGGMLGVEFLERIVVTIDFEAGTIMLTEPDRLGAADIYRTALPWPIGPLEGLLRMSGVRGSLNTRRRRIASSIE